MDVYSRLTISYILMVVKHPKVSVVITTKNEEKVLENLLESIKNRLILG